MQVLAGALITVSINNGVHTHCMTAPRPRDAVHNWLLDDRPRFTILPAYRSTAGTYFSLLKSRQLMSLRMLEKRHAEFQQPPFNVQETKPLISTKDHKKKRLRFQTRSQILWSLSDAAWRTVVRRQSRRTGQCVDRSTRSNIQHRPVFKQVKVFNTGTSYTQPTKVLHWCSRITTSSKVKNHQQNKNGLFRINDLLNLTVRTSIHL
jgi:hypothetical protein